MANIKQQRKRVLIQERQRGENLRYRSTIKTLTKRLEAAVSDGDAERVATEHRELVRTIDRAIARGALHKNTAARKKSRAARLVAERRLASSLAAAPGAGARASTSVRCTSRSGAELALALERAVERGESQHRVVELLAREALGLR